jgi:hypothetical protein
MFGNAVKISKEELSTRNGSGPGVEKSYKANRRPL